MPPDRGAWKKTGGREPLVRDEYDVLLDDGSLVRLAHESSTWSIRGVYD